MPYDSIEDLPKSQTDQYNHHQKEAFLKALKTGWSGKITWHDIEVVSDENRVPSLKIKGEALDIVANLGAEHIHLSMSHTTEHAVAQVILEKEQPR